MERARPSGGPRPTSRGGTLHAPTVGLLRALSRCSRPATLVTGRVHDRSPQTKRDLSRCTVSPACLRYMYVVTDRFAESFIHSTAPPSSDILCARQQSCKKRKHFNRNYNLLQSCFPLNTYGRRAFSVAGPITVARWPGTHSHILSGIQRAAQTVLGVFLNCVAVRFVLPVFRSLDDVI